MLSIILILVYSITGVGLGLFIHKMYLVINKSFISTNLGRIKYMNENKTVVLFTGEPRYLFHVEHIKSEIANIEYKKEQHKLHISNLEATVPLLHGEELSFKVVMSRDFLSIGCTQINPKEYKRIYNFFNKIK